MSVGVAHLDNPIVLVLDSSQYCVGVRLVDALLGNLCIAFGVVRATCTEEVGCLEDIFQERGKGRNVVLKLVQIDLLRESIFDKVTKRNVDFPSNDG